MTEKPNLHCFIHGWQVAVERDGKVRCPACNPRRSWWQKLMRRLRPQKPIPPFMRFVFPVLNKPFPVIEPGSFKENADD